MKKPYGKPRKFLEPVFGNKTAADKAGEALRQNGWTTRMEIRRDQDNKQIFVLTAEKWD